MPQDKGKIDVDVDITLSLEGGRVSVHFEVGWEGLEKKMQIKTNQTWLESREPRFARPVAGDEYERRDLEYRHGLRSHQRNGKGSKGKEMLLVPSRTGGLAKASPFQCKGP